MRRVSAKFVPKLLTEEQKELRKEICKDMLDCANHDPEFMKTIITGDEIWVYGYDPETKFQSSQWKHPESPRPKKARQVRSKVTVMLTCFFDSRGIVHHEYAPEGQTINKEYYLEVLRRLRATVQQKIFQLHHDNAPAHSAHVIQDFLPKTACHLFDRLRTLRIWHHVIFGYFRHWKRLLKESGSSHGRTSYKNRRRS